MTRSMTGYGQADFVVGGQQYNLEIKSLNHRHLDIKTRMPERFMWAEDRLRDLLKSSFARGSFVVAIRSRSVGGDTITLKLNVPLLEKYIETARELTERGIPGAPDVPLLLNQRDMLVSVEEERDEERDWLAMESALVLAFKGVSDWREKEGGSLKEDMESRIKTLRDLLDKVIERAPEIGEAYRKKITARLEELIGADVDEARILSEGALVAEKSAFDEEVTRLSVHLDRFVSYLGEDEPVGRKLDFLCQEILREANTIASKAPDLEVTQTVVEIKGELEKIREQVQNIE